MSKNTAKKTRAERTEALKSAFEFVCSALFCLAYIALVAACAVIENCIVKPLRLALRYMNESRERQKAAEADMAETAEAA